MIKRLFLVYWIISAIWMNLAMYKISERHVTGVLSIIALSAISPIFFTDMLIHKVIND